MSTHRYCNIIRIKVTALLISFVITIVSYIEDKSTKKWKNSNFIHANLFIIILNLILI